MKKIIILVFIMFSALLLNINDAYASIIYTPEGSTLVVQLDFNYPETNYIYYNYDVDGFDLDYAMGMLSYNDVSRRYNFINYLWDAKDDWVYGSIKSFTIDIYLPSKRVIDTVSYNLEWGVYSYNNFDTSSPILLDSAIGSDYYVIKFVYRDIPLEDREVFDMYILDNSGRYLEPSFYGNSNHFTSFNRNYSEQPSHDFNLFVNVIDSDIEYQNGYYDATRDYGHYDGTDYITADEWSDKRYNDGLGQNRNFYGYLYNGDWLTAEQWGDIRYYEGIDDGQDTEIDWFSWATTFFLMPFKILNIQILPGIRIGYFALFSLLLGVVGWFFFLVGKGGGRRK